MKTLQKTDYKNYDYIDVSVKKSRARWLLDMYAAFGWEEIAREEHRSYDDVLNVSFRRPHIVPDKDELQFLQVCAESEFNRLDRLENTRHAASALLGIGFGTLGCILFICGLSVVCLIHTVAYLIAGCLLVAAGVTLSALSAAAAWMLYKGEEARCARQCEVHIKNICNICAQVSSIMEKKQ